MYGSTFTPETAPRLDLNLRLVERQTIERALHATGGNLSRAAVLLGIDRSTLRRKLSRYTQAGAHAAPEVAHPS